MKNKFVLLLLVIFFGTGCTFNEKETENYSYEEIPEIERNYSEVSDYELTWESMFDVSENQYYVYIYSTTCSHCEELKNFIILKALDLGNIYFIKGTSKDQITSDSKKSIGAEKSEDVWILGYPTLLKINDHKIAKNYAGINQIKNELK